MQVSGLRVSPALAAGLCLALALATGSCGGGLSDWTSFVRGAGPTAVPNAPYPSPTTVAAVDSAPSSTPDSGAQQASATPSGPALARAFTPVATAQDTPSTRAAATLQAPQPALRPALLPTPRPITQTENILVLGTDVRSHLTFWNTDSIMVLAIDRAAGQVGVINIPRDLWVDIPGYGENRINAADYVGEKMGYPGGGPALARRTLELATGIPTQHYVIFQQDGLIKLVDALGGVTVTLDCPLYEMVPDPKQPDAFLTLELPAGPVLLDGETAKKFVTYRYVESDWGRQRRQQQLVWALRNRALQGDTLRRIPQILSALGGMLTTDLSLPEILSLAAFGASLKPGDVHAANMGPELYEQYTTELGAWVLLLNDRSAFQERVAQVFSGRPLTQAGDASAGGCPPRPPGFGTPSPTATPAS